MGISGPVSLQAVNNDDATAEQNEARLRALVEENERLKTEIRNLRARIESLGGPSRGLTPPMSTGTQLNSIGFSGDDLSDSRRRRRSADSELLRPADERKSYLASAFVLSLFSPPPASLPHSHPDTHPNSPTPLQTYSPPQSAFTLRPVTHYHPYMRTL